MNSKSVRTLRIPSLLLAAALQVMPMVRVALPAAQATANVMAIIFRWTAGVAAALGGVQAVSGASTVITSPLTANAVQGQSFTLRLTTAPNQAQYWTATGLPAGLSLSGKNGSTLWQILGTPTVTGTFNVGLTAYEQQGSNLKTASTLALTVAPGAVAPAMTTQPASLTVTQGQSAAFAVVATGTAPLNIQWYFQNASLPGQTNSTLALNPVTTANAGNYDAVITNNLGSVTSAVATLTVIVPGGGPQITAQPSSLTVTQGQSAAFSVTATGTAPLRYQWRFQSANLSGRTNANLTLNPASTNNAGNYDVVITNAAGSVTSAVATLTVVLPLVAPAIVTPPASLTVTQGNAAAFVVTADGTAPLAYYWFKGSTLVAGPTGPALTVTNAQPADAGSYSVLASNVVGTAASAAATLVVQPAPQPPFISTQPADQSVLPGHPAAFAVVAGGTAPLQYQWYWNGSPLPGGTAPALDLATVQSTNTGGYFVQVKNTYGSATSAVARLSVVQVAGAYNGLFYETSAVSPLTSGFVTATVTAKGSYSGALALYGRRYSFSGTMDASGRATNTVSRGGILSPLTVELAVDQTGADRLDGRVTDGTWSAPLLADRNVFDRKTNPASAAGAYTLIVPGVPGGTNSPAGDGFGTVTVDASGKVMFKGTLADGTKPAQTAAISKTGDWPLYVWINPIQGCLLGWLSFTNQLVSDLGGTLSWTRGQQPASAYYPAGFAVETESIGSKYVPPPAGVAILDFATGQLVLAGGNLTAGLTNQIQLGSNNRITNLSSNKLTLTFASASGLFRGSVVNPATGKSIAVNGAVLQKQNSGRGFFLGANQSGGVCFGP